MRFIVRMSTPEDAAELNRLLRVWMELFCASAEVELWNGAEGYAPEEAAVLFWDLDGERGAPALTGGADPRSWALFLCSSDPRKAIDSYALHPTGFLQKPFGMEALERALERCVQLWWPALDRVELLCERVRLKLPLCQVLWVESGRRGDRKSVV